MMVLMGVAKQAQIGLFLGSLMKALMCRGDYITATILAIIATHVRLKVWHELTAMTFLKGVNSMHAPWLQ